MKNIFRISIMAFSFWLASCQSMLDVNDDPSRIGSEEATIQTLLPSAIRFSGSAVFGTAQYGAQYPQYLTGQAIAQYTPYGFDQLWRPFYTDVLPTLQEIISRAESVGAFNYSGIAKTLLALNLMNVTDIYGSAPYSNANKGTTNLYPCYDDMEDLYRVHIKNLIDGAIADLDKPLPTLPSLATVQNDYIYNGSIAQWKKAARAVRARYYLHLSEKDPALLASAATEAQNAFVANADDLQLSYEDVNANPWFSFLGNAANKIMQPSSFVTDLLSGRGKFDGVNDPRLPFYMTKSGNAADYIGLTPGKLIGSEAAVNVNITNQTWHARAIAPVLFITYAETQFILAEALFASNKAESYQAYLRGIEASLAKVGVVTADINAFLANEEIAVGLDNFALAHIMLQKYLALYLQIESWTDMRRYQYDPAIYEGLQKPAENQIPGGPWVQRSNLADDEAGVNTCLPDVPNQAVTLWLFE
jgi:hypothetical protein